MGPDPDNDRNESTNVPISKLRIETKPKRFDVFQNLKWNVSVYSKNFGTKPKLIEVFQLLFCKSKTFLFSKNFGRKPKLFDVFQLFFSKSKTLLYNPKKFRSERERFGSIMNFVSKTNIFDFFFGNVGGKTKANDL